MAIDLSILVVVYQLHQHQSAHRQFVLADFGSFSPTITGYNSPEFIGLQNYLSIIGGGLASVLSGFDFWRILLFNVIWTAVNLVFHVSIGVAIAVLLNQKGFRFKRFYRALYIIPWAMPGLVTAMIWNNMFDQQMVRSIRS